MSPRRCSRAAGRITRRSGLTAFCAGLARGAAGTRPSLRGSINRSGSAVGRRVKSAPGGRGAVDRRRRGGSRFGSGLQFQGRLRAFRRGPSFRARTFSRPNTHAIYFEQQPAHPRGTSRPLVSRSSGRERAGRDLRTLPLGGRDRISELPHAAGGGTPPENTLNDRPSSFSGARNRVSRFLCSHVGDGADASEKRGPGRRPTIS